jgi:hypothetical protein
MLALEPRRKTRQPAVDRSAEPAICAPPLRFRSSRRIRSLAAISALLSHGLGAGSPTHSREQRGLTCTFGGPCGGATSEPRLPRGGVHALRGRAQTISSAYGPQATSRPTSTARSNGKPLLPADSRWALRDSNLRPPPCKSEPTRDEASGPVAYSPIDLRLSTSNTGARDALLEPITRGSFASRLHGEPVTDLVLPHGEEQCVAPPSRRRLPRARST